MHSQPNFKKKGVKIGMKEGLRVCKEIKSAGLCLPWGDVEAVVFNDVGVGNILQKVEGLFQGLKILMAWEDSI
jgi:hypothetical protein